MSLLKSSRVAFVSSFEIVSNEVRSFRLSGKSALVLLHKKGSLAVPGSYRPIALVQLNVKILSKTLMYSLQQVIAD